MTKKPKCLTGATMPRKPAPIGAKFGRLTVIGSVHVGAGRDGHYQWLCRCDCGEETTVRANQVRRGHTLSCSCLNRERVSQTHRRHGMSYERAYVNWQNMIQRCENPKIPSFHNYGGRGIKVCDRWKVFENFYADMGERPGPMYSLDRINNDGNYEPGNCRWATPREQMLNTRRSIAKRARALGVRIMTGFEMENTRRDLIALRVKFGASSPVGHTCSNLIEQMETMRTYQRPAWADDDRKTLPALMAFQMKRLAKAVPLGIVHPQ